VESIEGYLKTDSGAVLVLYALMRMFPN